MDTAYSHCTPLTLCESKFLKKITTLQIVYRNVIPTHQVQKRQPSSRSLVVHNVRLVSKLAGQPYWHCKPQSLAEAEGRSGLLYLLLEETMRPVKNITWC